MEALMKILLISDLHFKEDNDWDKIVGITNNMIRRVTNKMKKDDNILVVTLGDIIDSAKPNAFQQAKLFYTHLQQNVTASEFRFVPGNHELIDKNLNDLNSFIKEYGQPNYTDKETVYVEDLKGLRMLYVDSTLSRMYDKPGQINLEEIKSKMGDYKNIICMHFPPCVQDGIDKNIPNSGELIATRTNYIFYGHQHGDVRIPDFLEKDTDIHSVGTLLKDDVNEREFLLLDTTGSRINYAYRYIHNEVKFTPEILLPLKKNLQSDAIKTADPSVMQVSCLKRKVKTIFRDRKSKNSDEFLWSRFIGADLDEYVKENDLIILCGDAGSGKSFELQRIYQNYISDEEYFPIWVQLKSVSNDKLNEYISYCKNTIDRKTPMLIFDGLDEMQSEIISKLISDIGSAVVGDSEIKVIISVRTALSQTVDGFIQCALVDIDDVGIKLYGQSKGIDAELFYKAICDSECLGLARKPFYLVEMAKLFASTNALPNESDLLAQMINNRFFDSDIKHSNTSLQGESLIENEALLHHTLSEISFFMQVHKSYTLSNLNYTHIWMLNVRNLLCRTGLLTKSLIDNVVYWEFEHNNFREYLAAKYLNQLPFDEIISIIVYDENRSKLRPAWLNVVAYLLTMQHDDKLINWLIANAKDALCDLESDKLSLKNRNELFIFVMNDAITKQLPIFSLYNVNKLGRYFQSDETVDFMLEILKTSTSDHAVSSVLQVLQGCDNFFGKEIELKMAILEKHLRDTTYEHIVELSLEVLARIFANDLSNIAAEVYALLSEEKRSRVFGALCELLAKADVVDNYVDNIIKTLISAKDIVEDYSVRRGIENALVSVKSVGGVRSVINFFCYKELPYVINSKEDIFAYNCQRAVALFEQGSTEILAAMIDCFISMVSKYDKRKCQIAKEFFLDTNTLPAAFEEILNRNLGAEIMMFTFEDIMDETLEDILIEKYLHSDTIDKAFKWYASRLPSNSELFMKIDNAVLKKDGARIQREPQIDWEKKRKECNQKYFNCLFDKNLFSKLINELLLYIKNNNITCEQLLSNSSDEIYDFSTVPHERQDLQNIRMALYHSGLTVQKVTQFFDYIDWEPFCTCEMCRMLEQNRRDIEIDNNQQRYVNDYLEKQLAIINFEDYQDDMLEANGNKYAFVSDIIKLAKKVNYVFAEDKLLEMLMLPWYVFISSTTTGESETLNFVSERIVDSKKLQEKILQNIKNKKLAPLAAQTHLLYCLENKLSDAVDIAIDLFNSNLKEAKHHKNTAVDYLLTMKGNKFVDDLVHQITDQDQLIYLAHCMKTDNTNLINKLVDENKKSESQILFLKELIELNNKYAIERYLELAKRDNALPDLHADDSRIGEITMAIRTVNDISLIDVISALFEVCYSKGFADEESFGLKGALDTVINNFMQVDTPRTKEILTNLISKYPQNRKLISTCNWHLNNIEKSITISNDLPWNLEEAIAFLKSHRT